MKKLHIIITIIAVMCLAMLITSCGQSESVQTDQKVQAAESTETAQQDQTFGDIGEAAAKQIALNKVPGAVETDIYEFEKEYDDGMIQYEGTIIYEGCEYDFEISGETGDIFDWEIESAD